MGDEWQWDHTEWGHYPGQLWEKPRLSQGVVTGKQEGEVLCVEEDMVVTYF